MGKRSADPDPERVLELLAPDECEALCALCENRRARGGAARGPVYEALQSRRLIDHFYEPRPLGRQVFEVARARGAA